MAKEKDPTNQGQTSADDGDIGNINIGKPASSGAVEADRPTQQELAKSGYITPDHWYETPEETAAKAAAGAPSNKMAAGAPENKAATPGPSGDLGETAFASDAALQAAEDAGLTAADFKGIKPSGVNGYTKADVDEAAARKEGR